MNGIGGCCSGGSSELVREESDVNGRILGPDLKLSVVAERIGVRCVVKSCRKVDR